MFCSDFGSYPVSVGVVPMGVVPNHMGDMCVCIEYVMDCPKRQEEAMNTERQSPSFFDRRHGLFYVLTGTQDRQLNVPSKGKLVVHWCSVRHQGNYHTGAWLCCPMAPGTMVLYLRHNGPIYLIVNHPRCHPSRHMIQTASDPPSVA